VGFETLSRIAALAAVALQAAQPAQPTMRWVSAGPNGEGEIRIEGLSARALRSTAVRGQGLESALRVYVCADPCDPQTVEALPNLWGRLFSVDGTILFRPRHAIAPGLTLVSRFNGQVFDRLAGTSGTRSLDLRVSFVAPDSTRPAVTGFFPSGDTVPANLLRIYIAFSAPMSIRDVEQHVRLIDENGGEIPMGFVDVPGGLWNPGRTRLTLFIHPGRVKQGIAPGESMGPVLKEGSILRVRIGSGARDLDGRTLREAVERTWRIGPPQRDALDPSTWILSPPQKGLDPLVVTFPRSLDHALAQRALAVLTEEGRRVDGTARIEAGETRFLFSPHKPWRPGGLYRLRVESILEDSAGNRLGQPFERMVGATGRAVVTERSFVAAP